DQSLPVYGDGLNIRDWLYVEDHSRALSMVLEQGAIGETYNIGGGYERTNLYVARSITELLDRFEPSPHAPRGLLISFGPDRPGHDRRYAIDASKLEQNLGWKPIENFESGLEKTVKWYLERRDWWQPILNRGYKADRLGTGPIGQ